MAHRARQDPGSQSPAPYQCPVCLNTYIHVFDHSCVVKDACCHFGETLVPLQAVPPPADPVLRSRRASERGRFAAPN